MSKIEISNDTRVIRHRTPARISHWMLVICFFMTMFTGVAFFFPDFAWLTEILGTPQIARAVHPFTGILMFFAFIYLALLYWDHNIPEKNDIRWAKGILEVLKGNEHAVADNGKYNFGQKMLFWTLNLAMVTLLVTGIIMPILLTLLLNSSIAYCNFASLIKCFHAIHWHPSTYVYGILDQGLYSWYC